MSPTTNPAPPDDLTDAGRGLWQEITSECGELLDARERATLAEACRARDEAERIGAALARAGSLAGAGSRRQLRPRPLLAARATAHDVVGRLLARLPDARELERRR